MMMSSPEPMALGSPTQSPTASSNPMNQYLPQFLLGEMTLNQRNHAGQSSSSSSSRYWPQNQTNSPPRGSNLLHNHNHYHGGSSSQGINIPMSRNYGPSAGYDLKLNLNPSGAYMDMKNEPQSSGYGSTVSGVASGSNYSPHSDRSHNNLLDSRGAQVPGAPPVNRLVDMLNKPSFNATANDSRPKFSLDIYGNSSSEMNMRQMADMTYTPVNSNSAANRLPSPPSPTQVDPFYIYGETIKMDDRLDETWITLFGFPQSATSYVLQEFSVYGQIVKHVPSSQGNWLHIKYQTKMQAKKALSKNGKVLANSLMIGCMPCIDKSVMAGGGPSLASPQRDHTILSPSSNTSVSENSNLPTSPPSLVSRQSGGLAGSRTFSNATRLDRTQSLRTTVRPLGQFNRNLDSTLSPNDVNI
jgi:nuclear pore complex protein Nup53